MIDYVIGLSIISAYIFIGYYLTRFIRKQITTSNPYRRLAILSFTYSMIFGLGIAGGGGDPGFALPFPIILTGIFDLWMRVELRIFIRGFFIPLIFWWIVIFVIMLLRDLLEGRLKIKTELKTKEKKND